MTNDDMIALIEEKSSAILDEDEILTLMANTNTDGWEVHLKHPFEITGGKYAVVEFKCKGEQSDEATFCGDTIYGKAAVEVVDENTVKFDVVEAEAEDITDPLTVP